MVKRLTLLFLLLALAGGVVSGTPLHSPDDRMMKCCKRAKSKDNTPEANAARLCCAVNCSDPAPGSRGASSNFAPLGFAVSQSIAGQIAALFPARRVQLSTPFRYSREFLPRPFLPKFIQHNSLLI